MEKVNKGIDDAFANGADTEVHAGDQAFEKIEEIYTESTKNDPTPAQKELAEIMVALGDLAKRAKEDPGLLFVEEVLDAAAKLKRGHGAEWLRLHKKLRDARVPIQDFTREIKKRISQEVREENAEEYASESPQGTAGDSEMPTGRAKFRKYTVEDGRIVHNRQTEDGIVSNPLCNFEARIVSEESYDDGIERTLFFVIEGSLRDGEPLPKLPVAATAYPSLAWVMQWGSRPIVASGLGTKDHLRAAIQTLSGKAARKTVYTHLGWRDLNGTWVYLHADGAIGNVARDEAQVSPREGNLGGFRLPPPPVDKELRDAVRASLKLIEVAPRSIGYALFAAAYRAPLAQIVPIDVALYVVGPSGNQKTELSAIAQAHYGASFNRLNLPGNWSSSENTLERQAFLAKDAVLVIDDFAPGNGQHEINAIHRKAERVFRAQGNGSGRGRMRADGTLRPPNPPRGMIISTGEDVPRGFSLRARLAIVEVSPGDVDLNVLTALQGHAAAGTLAKAMSAYIAYIGEHFEFFREKLPIKQQEYRSRMSSRTMHARTPDSVASLMIGLEAFGAFCVASGALNEQERRDFCQRGLDALTEVGKAQSEHQKGEDATRRFCELLSAALAAGQVHVADADTGGPPSMPQVWGWRNRNGSIEEGNTRQIYENPAEWTAMGTKIGWIRKQELLLDADSVYASMQKLARDQGDLLPLTKGTLIKRLVQKNIVQPSRTEKKNVDKRTVEGARRAVLVIPNKEIIVPTKEETEGERAGP